MKPINTFILGSAFILMSGCTVPVIEGLYDDGISEGRLAALQKEWRGFKRGELDSVSVDAARVAGLLDFAREMNWDPRVIQGPYYQEFLPYRISGRMREIQWTQERAELVQRQERLCKQAGINWRNSRLEFAAASRGAPVDQRTGTQTRQGLDQLNESEGTVLVTCYLVSDLMRMASAFQTRTNRLEIK